MAKQSTGTVDIRGKQYKTVALRVEEFRSEHPAYGVETEIVSRGDVVCVRAVITDESGRTLATGHAEEDRGQGAINRTSALENCETSAIGRALAALGYAGEEFASANEVEGAIAQQQRGENTRPTPAPSEELKSLLHASGCKSKADANRVVAWLTGGAWKTFEDIEAADDSKQRKVLGIANEKADKTPVADWLMEANAA